MKFRRLFIETNCGLRGLSGPNCRTSPTVTDFDDIEVWIMELQQQADGISVCVFQQFSNLVAQLRAIFVAMGCDCVLDRYFQDFIFRAGNRYTARLISWKVPAVDLFSFFFCHDSTSWQFDSIPANLKFNI
jgi:hypothetical protein